MGILNILLTYLRNDSYDDNILAKDVSITGREGTAFDCPQRADSKAQSIKLFRGVE